MTPKAPNILFVICDQMRSTALGCAGVEKVLTPHLDAFAQQGTRFTNAVSNTPACTPARATLLTGKHILSHGLVNNDMQLGHGHQSLARCLTARGYGCGYIGKWHLDGVNRGAFVPPGPRRQGFDDFWAGVECNHNYFGGYHYDEETRQPEWFDGYEPDGQTDLAIDYIEREADAPSPFCLFLSFGPPHCPYQLVPEMYRASYPDDTIGFLPNAVHATIQDPATRGKLAGPADLAQEEHDARKRRVIADYYAQVTALDACFGRLLACLDEQGLADDTIIVFTSDHGDMLFSQNRGWKSKPWRESVGIPLLVRWPGRVPSARVTNGPIGLVDLMPTLLRMTGTPIPEDVEGLDLSEFVGGNEAAATKSQYVNFPCMPAWFRDPEWRGVVTGEHTYIASREGPWLLYDDAADPFQLRNLVADPASKGVVAELHAMVQDWLAQTNDPFDTSEQIADRLCPGHVNCVLPNPPLEEAIRLGQRERMLQRAGRKPN